MVNGAAEAQHICFQQRKQAVPPTAELMELTRTQGPDPCFHKNRTMRLGPPPSDTHRRAEPLSLRELITAGLELQRGQSNTWAGGARRCHTNMCPELI